MRNVISTNSRADVSEEYAERVEKLLESLRPERETTRDNRWRQTDFSVGLYSYEAPDSGQQMWAVDYHDPASRELEETDSRTEALARYEEFVREAASNLDVDGDGYQERFTTTDVENVPGPLPELPEVTPQQVEELLDESGEPVLYLARTEDGTGDDLVLEVGQAAEVEPGHVVLTRAQVLEELGLSDDGNRVMATTVSVDDFGMSLGALAHEASKEARAAADRLFPVPAAS